MAHKYEHVSTGAGYKVKNNGVVTTVINQAGALQVPVAANLINSAALDETTIKYAEVAISSADIVATTAGKLGHASGVVLVADPGASKVVELISAILIYDYAGGGYAAGGNITINSNGGSALTGVVSAGNSLGATADKVVQFVPLAVAGNALAVNKGLNLVAASAFTIGSATGVVRVKVAYRVHTHGL